MAKDISELTEKELRDFEIPSFKTKKELMKFINDLVKRKHDYGTSVYAMSMSAVATFNYVASQLGVSGFQASCADMDILTRTRNLKHGFRILDYSNLLYPQYLNDEHFPNYKTLIKKKKEWLAKEAKNLLENNKKAHETVKKHWEYLSKLNN